MARIAVLAWVSLLAMFAVAGPARAQNVLSVEDIGVDAGEFDLVVSIDLAVDRDLTHLRFDLTFDPGFCNMLDDPTAIDLCGAGRALDDPDDTIPIDCASGSIRIDVLDDTGDVAIPAGSGPVVEVDFGSVSAGASGAFVFTPKNVLAVASARNVAVSAVPGTVAIRPVIVTTTTTPLTPTSTSFVPGSTSTSTIPPPVAATTTSTTSPSGGPSITSTTGPAGSTTTIVPGPSTCGPDIDNHPSFTAVHCGLAVLVARARGVLLSARFARVPGRLEQVIDRADERCAAADTRAARAELRSAMRILVAFRRRLGSPASRIDVPDDVREPLADAAARLLFEARFLRGFLACPTQDHPGLE
jgi:hypothetical protein